MSPQFGGGNASGTLASQAALVLVVEDYEDTRALLAWFLREAAFRVQTANDGIDGIQKAVALKPDLIVMQSAVAGAAPRASAQPRPPRVVAGELRAMGWGMVAPPGATRP